MSDVSCDEIERFDGAVWMGEGDGGRKDWTEGEKASSISRERGADSVAGGGGRCWEEIAVRLESLDLKCRGQGAWKRRILRGVRVVDESGAGESGMKILFQKWRGG